MWLLWTRLIPLLPIMTEDATALSVDEAAEILQMAVDAQLTREAQWNQGVMHVSIEQTGANAMSAELTLVWKGENVYVEVPQLKKQSINVEGKLDMEVFPPFRKTISRTEEWEYFPSVPVVHGWGSGRLRGIQSWIDVRPRQLCSTLPFTHIRLTDSMGRSISRRQLSGTQLEDGLVQIVSGLSRVYVIDPASDFDIVRIENDLGERSPEAKQVASPHMYAATYEWARDEHGVPYCQRYRAEYFNEADPDDPAIVREVTVTDYTSEVADEWQRFDLDSLDVPRGTAVEYLDSKKRRTWRYGVRGSEAKGLQQPDFDRLIEQMREKGFAAPDREE